MPVPREPQELARWVGKEWERGDRALSTLRRDYWLNRAFFASQQWVYWHPSRTEVIEYPRKEERVRATRNRILPNVVTLLARLTKRDLMFEVDASGTDDGALEGARLAEHLLEHYRQEQAWENHRKDEVFSTLMGANAAVLVEWDFDEGEALTDPQSGQTVQMGEPKITSLAVPEFTVQPGSRDWRDSPYLLVAKVVPCDWAKTKYQLTFDPKPDGKFPSSPLHRRLMAERQELAESDVCTVYTYFERPLGDSQGRVVTVINDKVVSEKPWYFPWKHLPVYVFRCIQFPQQWTGHTFVTDARPVQVALNHAVSVVSEHLKQSANARLMVADTAGIDLDDLTDEAGEFVPFDGTAAGTPAFYLAPPQLPRWINDQIVLYETAIDDLLFVHDISRGQAPGDRNSGLALSVLAEKDETPLGVMTHDQAQGWSEVGTMVLKLLERFVVEYREAAVRSEAGVPMVREWTGKHLSGQTKVRVPLESVMPYTRAAMQAWVLSISERFPALIPTSLSDLTRLLDLPNAGKFAEMADADAAEAQRENHLMSMGIIPALDERPLPAPWQNHGVHIAEHNRFRKSRAYYYAEPIVRQIVDAHMQAHTWLQMEEFMRQQQLAGLAPGSELMPQGNEPVGAGVPPDFAERQQASQMTSGLGANAPITGSATGTSEMTGEPDNSKETSSAS